ncbi:hypothetical protein [Stenoxybacter acetivorans]|uniref:hypothetical protein n=1 Tax=Stenoxybacter acetivorans TaxID=422441 RepID=UPI000569401C|nr:hypothetical protein [Stenoxybacter acetivorans]
MSVVKIKEETSNIVYSKAEKRCAIALVLICFILILEFPLIVAVISGKGYLLEDSYSFSLGGLRYAPFIFLPAVPMLILRPAAVSAGVVLSVCWLFLWGFFLFVRPIGERADFLIILFYIITTVLSALLNLIFSIISRLSLNKEAKYNQSPISAILATTGYAVWMVFSFWVSYLLISVILETYHIYSFQ